MSSRLPLPRAFLKTNGFESILHVLESVVALEVTASLIESGIRVVDAAVLRPFVVASVVGPGTSIATSTADGLFLELVQGVARQFLRSGPAPRGRAFRI